MHPIWSGSINFGLINIPIKLYSAISQKEIKFHFLHKKDLTPIRFAKICLKEKREIPYSEIVHGYEYEKGNYIVITEEDFKKADIVQGKIIQITNFVDEKEIDPIFFVKPYYLEPDKGSQKAYALLREALRKSGKVAIAQFVIRKKEHLGVIKPENKVIVLEEMRFNNEIREPSGLSLPAEKDVTKSEIELALKLINQLSSKFNIAEYEDIYKKNLEKIISEKTQGKKPTAKGKRIKITPIPDLLKALKESLENEQRTVKK